MPGLERYWLLVIVHSYYEFGALRLNTPHKPSPISSSTLITLDVLFHAPGFPYCNDPHQTLYTAPIGHSYEIAGRCRTSPLPFLVRELRRPAERV